MATGCKAVIGVFGGTGFYSIEGLTDVVEEVIADTPFGKPSCNPIIGTLHGKRVAFIARHGKTHDHTPSEVNYCANVWAMKMLGVKYIFAVSAVGSLKEEHKPMDIVLPLQFIDKTYRRRSTFYGEGAVVHVPMAKIISSELAAVVVQAAKNLDPPLHVPITLGGTYVCIEGPAFSTVAESHMHRQWGCSVVGMTNATEAKLAREAEIAFTTIALVTDYDCWRDDPAEHVNNEVVFKYLSANVATAKRLLSACVECLDTTTEMEAHSALRDSVLNRATMPQHTREKLSLVIGKYF
eukprot:TRINITY_DN17179_c0_g1_i1.p1 TRINITY_DN17179_c0_g1~~TRINITY_DN17179_c0_g1_i1.p1  ORF type:complete len:295 (-),score=82.50 TRINITY_DN17179_c0_g1_i1:188-1072(-)